MLCLPYHLGAHAAAAAAAEASATWQLLSGYTVRFREALRPSPGATKKKGWNNLCRSVIVFLCSSLSSASSTSSLSFHRRRERKKVKFLQE